uniref:Genome polyprotein n=1 Tax=Varroa destructor virus 2 TaxID=2056384 RepID=A0A5P8TXX3_9VIRU|nr:polyprotein [Varroa destructor virus 2]
MFIFGKIKNLGNDFQKVRGFNPRRVWQACKADREDRIAAVRLNVEAVERQIRRTEGVYNSHCISAQKGNERAQVERAKAYKRLDVLRDNRAEYQAQLRDLQKEGRKEFKMRTIFMNRLRDQRRDIKARKVVKENRFSVLKEERDPWSQRWVTPQEFVRDAQLSRKAEQSNARYWARKAQKEAAKERRIEELLTKEPEYAPRVVPVDRTGRLPLEQILLNAGWVWDRRSHTIVRDLELRPFGAPLGSKWQWAYYSVPTYTAYSTKAVFKAQSISNVPKRVGPSRKIRLFTSSRKSNAPALLSSMSPQMDNAGAHGEQQSEQVVKNSDTLVVSASTSSAGQHPPISGSTIDLCGDVRPINDDTLAGRAFVYRMGEWTTSQPINTRIFRSKLPCDVIVNFNDQPNFAHFNNHKYWHGDMEVELHVTSNARMIGSLQMSWYYGLEWDAHRMLKSNVYTNSQTMHCLVDAMNSNVGVLRIPFRYPKAFLDLQRVKMGGDVTIPGLYLGTLDIRVLNQLAVSSSNTANVANWTLSIKFINNKFMGPVHRQLLIPQMMGAWMAYQMFKELKGDNNRDQPINPSTPSHIKPVPTDNWASGNGQSSTTFPLRLNPNGLLVYNGYDRASDIDEMKVDFVKSVFGLLHVAKWSAQDTVQTCIYSMPVDPILPPDMYYNHDYLGENVYALPPVGVLASMFSLWRGELEVRLDVIAATDVRGRLMLAYVPSENEVEYAVAMGSSTVYYDIDENRSFTWTIPYMSDRPWRMRRYQPDSPGFVRDHGKFYIFITNRLIINNTVPDFAYINIYIRGAPSFEVAVPCQPLIGLAWEPKIRTGTHQLEIGYLTGYWPVYVGGWRYNGSRVVMRYGETTDHIAQLDYGVMSKFLTAKVKRNVPGYFKIKNLDPSVQTPGSNYAAFRGLQGNYLAKGLFPVITKSGYCYTIPVVTDSDAVNYYRHLKETFWDFPPQQVQYVFVENSEYWCAKGNQNLVLEWTDIVSRAEMDERMNVVNGVNGNYTTVRRTGHGLQLFGESFGDLKDVLRRTTMYMACSQDFSSRSNLVDIKLPVIPQGLVFDQGSDENPNYSWNWIRQGNNQIINSGYRFFSGGMHFKIRVFSEKDRVAFFAQHRPHLNYIVDRPTATSRNNGDSYVTLEEMWQHGYATMVQDAANNRFLEIEVPFYQMGTCGIGQRVDMESIVSYDPDLIHYCSLGEIVLGSLGGNSAARRTYQVWSHVSDDFRLSTFQGFPQMIFLSYQDPVAVPDEKPIFKLPKVYYKKNKGQRVNKPSAPDMCELSEWKAQMEVPEMYVPVVSDIFHSVRNVSETSATVRNVVNKIDNILPTGESSLASVVDSVLGKFKDSVDYNSVHMTLSNIMSNIVHCLINPDPKTIAWALMSIIYNIFHIKGVIVSRVIEIVRNLIAHLVSVRECMKPQMDGMYTDVYEPLQGADEGFVRKNITALLSLIMGAVFTYLGSRRPINYNDSFASRLYEILIGFSKNTTQLVRFFQNTIELFIEIFDWCVGKICPQWDAVRFLASNDRDLYKWAKSVQYLTDGRNRNLVLTNPKLVAELYASANEACLIRQRMLSLDKSLSNAQTITINKLINDILTFRDQASGMHVAPPVKFEPYVLQLGGPPNIGKSHLLQELTVDLLESVGYTTWGEPIYIRSPGNDYWNGLTNQPIVIYDDFLAVTADPVGTQQISELFQLKTRCVFNPPMAAVEDKTIRYNPIIVGIASNCHFWNLCGVSNPEAVYRRRDVLIDVALKGYKKISEVPPEVLKEYGHLKFRFYYNPAQSLSPTTEWQDYADFKLELCKRFKYYYEKESKKFRDLSEKLYRLAPKAGEEEFKFANHEVGEALDKFFERHNVLASHDDIVISEVMNMISEKARNRRPQIYSKMGELLKKGENSRKMTVSQALLEAYCLTNSPPLNPDCVRDKIYKNLQDRSLIPTTEKIKLAMVKAKLEAQMETEEPSMSEYMCVHEYMCQEWLMASMLHWESEREEWVIRLHAELAGNDERLEAVTKWQKKHKVVYEIEKDTIRIDNQPCGSGVCPWGESNVKAKFLSDFIQLGCGVYLDESRGVDIIEAGLVPKDTAVECVPTLEEMTDETWLTKVRNLIWKTPWKLVYMVLTGVIAALGLIAGVASLWHMFKATPQENIEGVKLAPESPYSYDPRRGHKSKVTMKMGRKYNIMPKSGKFRGQALLTHTIGESCNSIIKRNTFFIRATYELNGVRSVPINARCLGVTGRYAIFPLHYNDAWERLNELDGVKFEYYDVTTPIPIEFAYDEIDILASDDSAALAFIRMPKRFRVFRDIRNHFISNDKVCVGKTKACLFELKIDLNKNLTTIDRHNFEAERSESCKIPASEHFNEFTVSSAYRYSYGGAGVCGSVLFDWMGNIIGMHVAGLGDGSVGMSEWLTETDMNDLTNLMSELEDPVGEVEFDPEILPEKPDEFVMNPTCQVLDIGMIHPSFRNFVDKDSKLIRSPVHRLAEIEHFPDLVEPAILDQRDSRYKFQSSPLFEGVKHHGRPMRPLPLEMIEEAVGHYTHKVLSLCRPTRPEPAILSVEEACMGVEGVKLIAPLDWGSSAGWPWRISKDVSNPATKSSWVKLTDDNTKFVGLHPDLEEVMNIKHEQRVAGIVPLTVFADILKDELVPHAKAMREGATRIVSMSPIDFTIQQRQYTMDFVASFMYNRLDLEHAIGINPDSSEWTDLYVKLAKGGKTKFITGDYSKFGDKLPTEIGVRMFGVIGAWYARYAPPEQVCIIQRVLSIMALEVFNAKHIADRWVYQCVNGLPSGNTMTVVLNSMVNSIFIRIAWMAIMSNTEFSGLDNFEKYTSLYSYGDDVIIGLDDCVCDLFNTLTIRDFFARYDLKFTDADKEGIPVKYRTLDDMTFLKRNWQRVTDRKLISSRVYFLAPLAEDSMFGILHWIKKGHEPIEFAKEMSEESARMAFTHGEEYYNNHCDKIKRIWQKMGHYICLPNWHDLAYRTYLSDQPLLRLTRKLEGLPEAYGGPAGHAG